MPGKGFSSSAQAGARGRAGSPPTGKSPPREGGATRKPGGKYANVHSKIQGGGNPNGSPVPGGYGRPANGSRVPPWDSPAKLSPNSRSPPPGMPGHRMAAWLEAQAAEPPPKEASHKFGMRETPPESRASRDAKRRLCAFAGRQKALEERRERLMAAADPPPPPPKTSTAPTKMLLRLAPSNFKPVADDHAIGEVMSRRQGTNRALAPPPERLNPEDLIFVGEVSNRTKEKEFRNFFMGRAERATPTQAQVAAHRQQSPPHSPKEGAGFQMFAA